MRISLEGQQAPMRLYGAAFRLVFALVVGVAGVACRSDDNDTSARATDEVRATVGSEAGSASSADEPEHEIERMRNGRIVSGEWDAFDQNTGSFLYDGDSSVKVVRKGEPVAEFTCPPSAACGLMGTFGPGPDEATVPTVAPSGDIRSVQILSFDATVRDTLDISGAVTQDQELADLAWSLDGNQLAISTEPTCIGNPCEGQVWIINRDGGEPQLVFTERASDDLIDGPVTHKPVLRELAWSPDGGSVSLLVTSQSPAKAAKNGVWPRLVALRLPPDEPVTSETLHVYDDVEMPPWNVFEQDYRYYFASAWSPEGTRIAVTSKDGVAEISAEDGQPLARHPRQDPHGLLAWLPK